LYSFRNQRAPGGFPFPTKYTRPGIQPRIPHEAPIAVVNLDHVPTLGGRDVFDVDLDKMEDRPWMMPGADKTDYFNYGFDEQTWKIYAQRQSAHRRDIQMKQAITVFEFSFRLFFLGAQKDVTDFFLFFSFFFLFQVYQPGVTNELPLELQNKNFGRTVASGVRPGGPPGPGVPFTHPLAAPGHVPGQPLNLTAPGRGATQTEDPNKVVTEKTAETPAATGLPLGLPNG